ncbi:hypothetical protein [Pedobacter ginsengisoli]|uniref:hypothetical protein n=1 Tax=Pedobacter ginsengisoli TaxID=363852 RepID=UPI0025513FE3|nr:hypothetical protein [Pedobacter ginsengisoli]
MKRATYPTSHILIRANNSDDIELVHFAIKEVTIDWLIMVQRRFMMTRSMASDNDLYADAFWDPAIDYYRNPKDRDLVAEVLEYGEDWAYIVLEAGELESFVPVDPLEAHQLLITANGLALFKAYDKYTGAEYWTDDIRLDGLLRL